MEQLMSDMRQINISESTGRSSIYLPQLFDLCVYPVKPHDLPGTPLKAAVSLMASGALFLFQSFAIYTPKSLVFFRDPVIQSE